MKRFSWLGWSLGFCLLTFGWLSLSPFLLSPAYSFGLFLTLKGTLILGAAYCLTRILLGIRKKGSFFATSLWSILLILLVAEFVFTCIPYCNNNDKSLNSRLWYKFYWETDEAGIRMSEMEQGTGKRVYFIGDSFTAGVGISDPKDRYPDQVQAAFPEWNITNLSRSGWNIMDYQESIHSLDLTDALVYVALVPNDIEGILSEEKLNQKHTKLKGMVRWEGNGVSKFFAKRSFLFNFLVFKWVGRSMRQQVRESGDMYEYLSSEEGNWHTTSNYLDAFYIKKFKESLGELNQSIKNKGGELRFIYFPFLKKEFLEFTEEYCNRPFYEWTEQEEVEMISVYPLVRDINDSRLTINIDNAHPSKETHEIVARAVIESLQATEVGSR